MSHPVRQLEVGVVHANQEEGIVWISRLCKGNTRLEGKALGEVVKLSSQNATVNIAWINFIKGVIP